MSYYYSREAFLPIIPIKHTSTYLTHSRAADLEFGKAKVYQKINLTDRNVSLTVWDDSETHLIYFSVVLLYDFQR